MSLLTFIMAGGKGSRLWPLTKNRAKPAVHFGGKYRIIDFVINNFINSGFHKIKVLTQYKSSSLNNHINKSFTFNRSFDMFVDIVPAQMRKGDVWYRGTADAVGQNINELYDHDPEHVAVFGGDHIYKMDINQMLNFHKEKNAKATISVIPIPIEQAKGFGIVEIDNDGKIIGFQEKPENPAPMPNNPDYALVSMGNYLFNADFLHKLIYEYVDEKEMYDFGFDIFPAIIDKFPIYAYNFATNDIEGESGPFWRDVGTIGSYYDASMDLIDIVPKLNMYNNKWPIRTTDSQLPPAKFVHNKEDKIGMAINSIISEGVIVSGAKIEHSIISKNCTIKARSSINNSLVLPDCVIGKNVELSKVIIERNVKIPNNIKIGFNKNNDEKYFTVTPENIVVVPQDFDWSNYKNE